MKTIKIIIDNFKIGILVYIHKKDWCRFLHRWDSNKPETKPDWVLCWQSYCPIIDRIQIICNPIVKKYIDSK